MSGGNKRNYLVTLNKRFYKYIILAFFFIILIFILLLKQKPAIKPPPVNIIKGEISAGESFYSCLFKKGLSAQTIYKIIEVLKPFYDVRICNQGDKYEIIKSTDDVFLSFRFYHNIHVYAVEKPPSGVYTASYKKVPMEEKVVGISGKINDNLWTAMMNQGLSADLIIRFMDIFSCQIDFLTEPRQNDKYKLVWIRYMDTKGNAIDDKILSAGYEGKETSSYTAVIFNNKYYDMKGNSLKKQFLRAPLNYRRISSSFTKKRFHPILKYYRPHKGIDYMAFKGTPVVSIGDGTVTYCGRRKEEGRCVVIKHNSIYTTSYSHLSKYGRGVRKGVKVKQGQVIGYVGSTGFATGSHLDFRIKKYGKFVNFLKLRIPPRKSVKSEKMKEFNKIKKKRLSQLASVFKNTIMPVSE